MTKNEQLEKWYASQNNDNGKIMMGELDFDVDIVIIDKKTRMIQSITVWCEIRNVGRLQRLVARENSNGDSSREAIMVRNRSKGRGELLLDNEIITL